MNLKAIRFELDCKALVWKHQKHVRHDGVHEGEFDECTKLYCGNKMHKKLGFHM